MEQNVKVGDTTLPEAGPYVVETFALHEAWRFGPKDRPLAPIDWVAAGPLDQIALTQRMDGAVVVLDSVGGEQARLGRPGEGPGEFRMVNRIGWTDDELWVADSRLHRTIIFDTSWMPRLTYALYSHVAAGPSGDHVSALTSAPPIHLAVLSDSALAFQVFPSRRLQTVTPFSSILFATDVRGDTLRTVFGVPLPDQDAVVSVTSGTNTQRWPLPYAPVPTIGVAAAGHRLVLVTTISRGQHTDSVSVLVVSTDPAGTRRSALQLPAIPLPGAERKAKIEEMRNLPLLKFVIDRERIEQEIEARTPARYPPVTAALVAPGGEVWLERPPIGGSGQWLVLAARDAMPKAVVSVPGGIKLLAVGHALAWGLETEADGGISVVAFYVPPGISGRSAFEQTP